LTTKEGDDGFQAGPLLEQVAASAASFAAAVARRRVAEIDVALPILSRMPGLGCPFSVRIA